ncbi:MAG: phenylalanine--tRNA ligase subunit beta, partial [Firmicutes bacterium]|nr:phenylalanine--tRNA ligase subunit beta [Bacillota bacterium]
MRISYNWLKDYIDLNIDADELGRRYTAAGLELDETVSRGRDFSGVVVGRVLTCEPVEGSDHLHLCSVDIGEEAPLTVFCGAPNVAAGQLVCCAKVGAKLPGDFVIGERKMFGRISQGMICSQQELGVSEDHSGIWVLDDAVAGADAPLGADVADALQLKDDVLIIELTPNRSDCLGMLNCAREAGALTGLPVKEPVIAYAEEGPDAAGDVTVRIEDFGLCSRYAARIVKNVKIGPSPLWMQKYLLAAGMRPINNVVDISNFVMLELNQPLHTFDYDKIKDKTIVVRAARPGETMQTLDGKDRVFRGDEAMITDGAGGERPVCIAGIMGGMETEVTTDTTNILIEAACFDPTANRRAARRLGIPSEATQRFEKGIDVANCDT